MYIDLICTLAYERSTEYGIVPIAGTVAEETSSRRRDPISDPLAIIATACVLANVRALRSFLSRYYENITIFNFRQRTK